MRPCARSLIASIERMERITASALEYLKGESRGEPMRRVDLSALLESECAEFEELGHDVAFVGEHGVQHTCRPEALARAVRNLIDNAVKYGGSARVALRRAPGSVDIVVADNGPGIPQDKLQLATEPFERLSDARDSDRGGFGLGLAIARAIAEGHEGQLTLAKNEPSGLVATIRLPAGRPRNRLFEQLGDVSLERAARGIVAGARGRDVVPTFDALLLGPHACWQVGTDRDDTRGLGDFGCLDLRRAEVAHVDAVCAQSGRDELRHCSRSPARTRARSRASADLAAQPAG